MPPGFSINHSFIRFLATKSLRRRIVGAHIVYTHPLRAIIVLPIIYHGPGPMKHRIPST